MGEEVESEATAAKEEAATLREVRDEVVKDRGDVQKKLDVLTEFFNKKEAELQKQIGLQSAKFGDVNVDAENTTKRLQIVNDELMTTREQLQTLKRDLEDQERSLKASVGDQEKKAHECWVAARQAERKVPELQSETSVLKSRLTIAESKNFTLEKEKGELEGAIKSLKSSVRSESGADSCSIKSEGNASSTMSSLPPLPGLSSGMTGVPGVPSVPGVPGVPGGMMQGLPSMMLPGMMSMRPAPLGEISPSPRTGRRHYSPDRHRGYSRGHSPARSDRGGYRDT